MEEKVAIFVDISQPTVSGSARTHRLPQLVAAVGWAQFDGWQGSGQVYYSEIKLYHTAT